MGPLDGSCERKCMFSIASAFYEILITFLSLSERQQQRPSRTSTAVPAFGAPLPKPPDATLTTAPTPAGPSQGPKKPTLAEIDAEEEELEREAERLSDRRKQLRLERKQFH